MSMQEYEIDSFEYGCHGPHDKRCHKEKVVEMDMVRRDTLTIDSDNKDDFISTYNTNKSLVNVDNSIKVVIIKDGVSASENLILDFVSGFEGDDLYIINKTGVTFTIIDSSNSVADQKVCHFSRIDGTWYLFNIY